MTDTEQLIILALNGTEGAVIEAAELIRRDAVTYGRTVGVDQGAVRVL